METESAEEVSATENGSMIAEEPTKQSVPFSEKKGISIKAKRAMEPKTGKTAHQRRQSARTISKGEKLVCRYCGSDDLPPSFKKRRDARCRACFKKRYGSAARGKKAKRARAAKVAD